MDSYFSIQPPPVVYQTMYHDGVQNSSLPLEMAITLSQRAKASFRTCSVLSKAVYVALRRFDGAELEKFMPFKDAMVGARVSQSIFSYAFKDDKQDVLLIRMLRKELPVSLVFGGAKLMLTVYFKNTEELVCSSSFFVVSKQMNPSKRRCADVKKPKRVRLISRHATTFEPAKREEEVVNELLKRHKPTTSDTPPTAYAVPAFAIYPSEPSFSLESLFNDSSVLDFVDEYCE